MKGVLPSSGGRTVRATVLMVVLCALAHPLAGTATAQSGCFIQTPVGAGDNEALAVALQADGKIVVAGYSFNGVDEDFTVIRYNADLSLDTSFGGTGIVVTPIGVGNDRARAVAIQPDGKIVAAGFAFNGVDDDFAVARYNPDGSLDASFGTGGVFAVSIGALDQAHGVAIQSDGRIVVAGGAFMADDDFAVIRLNTNGTLDASFDVDGIVTTPIGPASDIGRSVAIQLDGKIVVGGYFSNLVDLDLALARYNPNGSLDTSFDGDGIVTTSFSTRDETATALAIQSNGKILLTGAHDNGTDDDWILVRYAADGSLDTSFDGDGFVTTAIGSGSDWANAIVVQPDDRIVVAGHSHNGTDFDIAVGRYNRDGSLHTAFDTDGIVTTPLLSGDDRGGGVAIEADGRIVVVGYTDDLDRDHALVRYERDGSLACGQISLHPTGNGSINTFSIVSGCADNWDCVNDQPLNAGSGPAVANDGLTTYLQDASGLTNREMFTLDDGTVPLGATITKLEIRAQVGTGGGPPPSVGLSYRRIGWDGAPVDGPSIGFASACCTFAISWTVSGISWSAAELDALEVGLVHVSGGQLEVSQIYVTVTYLLPPTPQSYLRSIGTRLEYGTAGPEGTGTTVTATNGNKVVTGSGTAWLTANRGRGDRIQIDGVDYTILSVDAENVLTLTTPFVGAVGAGKPYTISRQFTTLQTWEDCISGTTLCPYFPVATSSLVADNRYEIGVAYNDSVFTHATPLLLQGATTDADHTITLTVDPPNRHNGIPGAGVVVDGQDGPNGIQVRDDYVSVEWLEVTRVRGSLNRAAIEVAGPTAVTGALLQNLLIHDYYDPVAGNNMGGIQFRGVGVKDATIRNVMIWDGDRYGIQGGAAVDTLLVDNVSIDDIRDGSGVGIDSGGTFVLAKNTIVTSSPGGDFVGVFDAASTNNTSSDGSAPGANPQLGVLALDLFVASGIDLHLKPGPNPAVDNGVDLSAGFTRDIDDTLRSTPWDRGADERDPRPFRIHYRSIGTSAAILASVGTASIVAGMTTATFTTPLPPNVGRGDELVIGAETFYILTVDSPTEVTVQTPATAAHLGEPYTIRRAYNTLQDWESAREGDLVSENRREVGVIYNDGIFTAGLEINDSITDATRFMKLTVAPLHRHTGTAGSGAVMDGLNLPTGQIEISDDYSVLEWLEVHGVRGATTVAGVRVRNARRVVLSNLLVHDNREGLRISGVGGNDFIVRNSFIYRNDDDGIGGDEITDTVTVENCTVFANLDNGLDKAAGTTFLVTNTISVGNADQDYDMTTGTQSNNVSSDGTAFGPGSLPFRSVTINPSPGAGDWVIFVSVAAGTENLHLRASVENDAIDRALDLSPSFWDDIDGTSRTAPWDIGADELGAPTSGVILSSMSNQSFVVGSSPTTTVSIFVTESALGGNITAANDIRLRVPAGFNMRWDTSITTVTLNGGAARKRRAERQSLRRRRENRGSGRQHRFLGFPKPPGGRPRVPKLYRPVRSRQPGARGGERRCHLCARRQDVRHHRGSDRHDLFR